MVIDSDGDVRDLLEAMIELADDLQLARAIGDAERGVASVAALQPDLVLFDLDRPDADAMQTVAELRAAAPDSRIIVFSAFPDPMTLMEVLRRGADDYLDKARTWAELLPVIDLLCARSRSSR